MLSEYDTNYEINPNYEFPNNNNSNDDDASEDKVIYAGLDDNARKVKLDRKSVV